MKHHGVSFLLKFLRDQRGQTSVFLALSVLVTATLGGAAIEAGHVYYAYQRLEASTNAAAVAAGQAMPNIGTSGSPAAGTAYYNLYKYSSDTSTAIAPNTPVILTVSYSYTWLPVLKFTPSSALTSTQASLAY